MPLAHEFRRFFRLDRGTADVEREVDDELRFHFEMTRRELMSKGMSDEQARAELERRFGNVDQARDDMKRLDRERVSRERRAEWWSAVTGDVRYALRGMKRNPTFVLGVVLTLGLGIGAN